MLISHKQQRIRPILNFVTILKFLFSNLLFCISIL